jgi:hypothetical protein
MRESIFDGGDVATSIVDIEAIKFTRGSLTLDEIAAGAGQVPFGETILPPNALPGLSFLDGTYELTELRGQWSFNESYSQGTTTQCSGSGGGNLSVSNVFSSIFDVAPYLRGTISGDIPSLYRSFFVQVVLATSVT